ncbi:tRNA preQ1(34) S-adenosylmethionine ribosyltransferase-isomerase QueA [Patescibacteria group bacterium]|nr:tRNA preQ1(34) S-adenosylmethionine ribosyltransferase-isomerase QueA [Patescibacteria group bacterium]MBU1922125.1 tRNA preQ1(34) S-adenosylmethionine ribosyltransferase-isomerase QueA [Patescibacteria group bacterium]
MLTEKFNYNLPKELIAQKPVRPRDHSRLMVIERKGSKIQHRHFYDLPEFLKPGDVLVFNQSKVFKARIFGKLESGGANIEIFLLNRAGHTWRALAQPGKKLKEGGRIIFKKGLRAEVASKDAEGIIQIRFNKTDKELLKILSQIGTVPTPPYIKSAPKRLADYQTVYAKDMGSVAAPTAGFHFTKPFLKKLKTAGVQTEFLTLHVGLGTFRPIKSEKIEAHKMHSEFVSLDLQVAKRLNQAKREGRRIIAVGTTTVRALEGIAKKKHGLKSFQGQVNLFIAPGFKFKIIDAMLTNFHLPKSTLLVLVSAFVGRDKILKAYRQAVKKKYRFYSFGDAMLVM